MLERANFQEVRKRSTSVLVTIPLSWGFVNDLRRAGYLSEQNSHNKEKIGSAVASAARDQVALKVINQAPDVRKGDIRWRSPRISTGSVGFP